MDQESVDVLLPNEYWNDLSIKKTRVRKPIIILSIQNILLTFYTIFTFVIDYLIHVDATKSALGALQSSALIYLPHLVIRLLCLAFKLYLDRYYHNQLKLYGYHRHHSESTFLSELTHILFNKITFLLLLNSSYFQVVTTNHDDTIHLFGLTITQTQVAKIITGVISCVITFVSCKKLYIEVDFQAKNPRPDTITDNEEDDTSQSPNDIGIRFGDTISDFLSCQHDTIKNLKMQNQQLKRLLMMKEQRSDLPQSAQ